MLFVSVVVDCVCARARAQMVASDPSVNVRLQKFCKKELGKICGGDDPNADHG